ncbi:unnamed protein product [Paramecium sonneborni]|uniref:Tetratricopeptide repeat protein n=1 Tax=Paramecium sonneborni TaxID=65129 RepID=A0A8S1M1Y0_9CILI|nr:unnamed protein product [Paramecium sonneborni]
MNRNFYCLFIEHQENDIIGFCLNKQCQTNPQICFYCIVDKHKEHLIDCKNFKALQCFINTALVNSQATLLELKEVYEKIEQQYKNHFQKIQREIQTLSKINQLLKDQYYYEIKQEINFLKDFNSQELKETNYQLLKTFKEFEQTLTQQSKKSTIINSSNQTQENISSSQIIIDDLMGLEIINKLYQTAICLFKEQKYQEAQEILEELLSSSEYSSQAFQEKNNEAFSLLIQILVKQNLFQQALKVIDKQLQKNPNLCEALYKKGQVLTIIQNFEESIIYFDKAIAINPQMFQAYYDKGIDKIFCKQKHQNFLFYTYQINELKKYSEAAECSQIYIKRQYNIIQYNIIQYNIIISLFCLFGLDEYEEEALNLIDKAIEINPQYEIAYNNKAFALLRLLRYKEAITCCQKAIKLNPKFSFSYNNIGYCLINLNRKQEAIKWLDKAIELNPQLAQAHKNRGEALIYLNQLNEALNFLDQAIKINPKLIEAHYNKALALILLNKLDQAINICDYILKINPKFHAAINLKGDVLHAYKNYDNSIECFQKAFQIQNDPIYLSHIANSLLADGKKNMAKQYYQQAFNYGYKDQQYIISQIKLLS